MAGAAINIVFLSRGHGFGHAARDLRIINALNATPDVHVDVMSAGTGVTYYRSRGVECVDLGITDENDISRDASWAIWRRLAKTPSPWNLIVTDVLVPVLPFAHHVLQTPVVVLTDWLFADFGQPKNDRVFDTAAEIIMLDFPESHPMPPATTAPVHHAGPVVAGFPIGRADARTMLGIAADAFVAVVSVGGRPGRPEARRMISLARRAWQGVDGSLFILASPQEQAAGADGTVWVGLTAQADLYHAAADVVMVDEMGFTACELVYNRVPVVALSDASTVGTFPASFHRRATHMAAMGWATRVDTAADPAELRRALQTAPREPAATALPAADLPALVARLLRHSGAGRTPTSLDQED